MAQQRKQLLTAFKIIFSAVLLYFIFTKIQLIDVLAVLKTAHLGYVLLAVLFFILSKIIAAMRLNLYFHQLQLFLTQWSNIQLYWLGMFYNLFLPGGIGGDAYKGYLIKKTFNIPTKRVVSVLVVDRLSGLLLLFLYACGIALTLEYQILQDFKVLIAICIPLSIVTFWFLNKKFFSYIVPAFWTSFIYSSLVQLAQLGSVYFILQALQITEYTTAYLFIFLISSIVSVLPLTIGGIGAREITFLYGATWFSLKENTSVSISMLFFLITAIVSLMGIWYHFQKPKLITKLSVSEE